MHGQSKLLQLLESEKIDCMIIKGAAAAMAYPQPMLRRCGDIDFLVKQADFEKAAQVLENNGYELAEEKDPTFHHFEYSKSGISYELHRWLAIIRKDSHELINLFEESITHRETAQIEDFSFPVLPLHLNGLVLLFHINQHLRKGLGMRHMLDWMTYLNENDNLQQLLPILEKTGMEKLALRDRLEEPADLGVAIDLHLIWKEKMSKSKIRIILNCVLLLDNQVGSKIKDESGVIAKPFGQHRTPSVFISDASLQSSGSWQPPDLLLQLSY